jgi:DNA-binding response OmpR family regulator
MIAQHLTEVGHVVTLKNNLAEAVNWLQIPGNLPDLIISDMMMSKTSHHRFIRQVRCDPAGIYPPVILLADRDNMADKIAGFEAGADDYMVKPVNAIELSLRVRALLARTQVWRSTAIAAPHR